MKLRRVDFIHTPCPGCGQMAQMYSQGIGSPACVACSINHPIVVVTFDHPGWANVETVNHLGELARAITSSAVRSNFGRRIAATGRARK